MGLCLASWSSNALGNNKRGIKIWFWDKNSTHSQIGPYERLHVDVYLKTGHQKKRKDNTFSDLLFTSESVIMHKTLDNKPLLMADWLGLSEISGFNLKLLQGLPVIGP